MLESLITSKTRIKLLLKFFLNPGTETYLRGLADELGESTNGVRVELDRFTKAGLIEKNSNGRKKLYRANSAHPLFTELNSVIRKYVGIDKLVDSVLAKLGNVDVAFLIGDYAIGIDSGIIDLVIVGEIDKNYLTGLVEKAEVMIKRKIRVLPLRRDELAQLKDSLNLEKALVVWGERNNIAGL
ncbi:MAG: ArsR family transcriptional regulator [bacterium]|nr:ArsR family transcriptional regulator [bacterium]